MTEIWQMCSVYTQYILPIYPSIHPCLAIYLPTYLTAFSNVVSNNLSMAQCFSLVFIFLRTGPRKDLVTQQPDEGPQITCLLVGVAQRDGLQSRNSPALSQLADLGQVTSSVRMPMSPTRKWGEEASAPISFLL